MRKINVAWNLKSSCKADFGVWLLTEGNTDFGVSSPAKPARVVCVPTSITRAEISSARKRDIHRNGLILTENTTAG
jgi:hypothetical protein